MGNSIRRRRRDFRRDVAHEVGGIFGRRRVIPKSPCDHRHGELVLNIDKFENGGRECGMAVEGPCFDLKG